MSNISTSSQLQFTNSRGAGDILKPNPINVIVLGENYAKQTITVDSTGTTLDLGAITDTGWIILQNTMTAAPPPSVDPVITQGGTPGTNNDAYILVFNYPDGSLSVSNQITTALANATLNGTNYNILTWTNPAGVSTVDLYRTLADGTPSTLGKIATGVTSPHNDQGAAGDGAATPTVINTEYQLEIGPDGSSWPLELRAGEFWPARWRVAAIHVKAILFDVQLQYFLTER